MQDTRCSVRLQHSRGEHLYREQRLASSIWTSPGDPVGTRLKRGPPSHAPPGRCSATHRGQRTKPRAARRTRAPLPSAPGPRDAPSKIASAPMPPPRTARSPQLRPLECKLADVTSWATVFRKTSDLSPGWRPRRRRCAFDCRCRCRLGVGATDGQVSGTFAMGCVAPNRPTAISRAARGHSHRSAAAEHMHGAHAGRTPHGMVVG